MRSFALVCAFLVTACGGEIDDLAAEPVADHSAALTGSVAVGSVLETLNVAAFRPGPGFNYPYSRLLPTGARLTAAAADPVNGFYQVDSNEQTGWVYSGSLRFISAPIAQPGASLGSHQLTYYWAAEEWRFPGTPTVNLYSKSCAVLATVTTGFASSLRMEGTGKLNDGRVLNYAGSCSCPSSPCYAELPASQPWGMGSYAPLVPFRSVAVDRNRIALGSHLYVKELDGVTMPGAPPTGGFVHDGCVRADDTGSAITEAHIDLFAGTYDWYRALAGTLRTSAVTVLAGGTRCP